MSFTVYKSSAGSGKTFTLVKEYLKLSLADDQHPPQKYRKILAITFTNKAASEMKERVLRALQELSELNDNKVLSASTQTLLAVLLEEINISKEIIQERSKNVLTGILHHYSDFAISTIDSFVHKIVRTFAFDLKLPMNFEIEMDAELLLSKAIEQLISKVGTNENLTKILTEFVESKTDDEKNWHIEKDLLEFAKNLIKENDEAFLTSIKTLSINDFILIKKIIFEQLKKFEHSIQQKAQEAFELIKSEGLDSSGFFQSEKGIYGYFKKLSEKNFDVLSPNTFVLKTINENKWLSSKPSSLDIFAIEKIKKTLEHLFHEIRLIQETEQSDYTLYQLIHQNIYPLAVLNEIEKLIQEIKQKENIIHISEFNKLISEIVLSQPAPFIYERLGEKYNHYLIDEFQDTSVMQWHNLLPLLDNSLAENNFNMLVGDAKQAIYRWRGGEVEQFSKLPEIHQHNNNSFVVEREATLKRYFNEKLLNNNFRSKAEIVTFNNDFFSITSSLLHESFRNIYDNHAQCFNPKNTGGYTAIDFIEGERKEYETNQYSKIIFTIHQLLEDGFAYKDIAILCRKNKHGNDIANYLTGKGIPIVSSDSLLLKKSNTILLLTALLQYLKNNGDQLARATIIEFLHNTSFKKTSLHRQFTQAELKNNFDEIIQSYEISFDSKKLLTLTLYEMCEELCQLFQLHSPINLYVSSFLDLVLNFSNRQSTRLGDFLDWWENEKNQPSLSISEGINAVKILTIHRSKGLEFPAVIIPYTNWKIDNSIKQKWISVNNEKIPQLKAGIINVSSKLQETEFESIYVEERNKSFLDNLNLLYVAFTRAEERLYIFTPKNNKQSTSISSVADIIKYYLEQKNMWNNEVSLYEYGSKKSHIQKNSSLAKTYTINSFNENSWKQKLQIKTSINTESPYENSSYARNRGILYHDILAKVNPNTSITQLVEKYTQLTPSEKKEVTQTLDNLICNPDLIKYFVTDATVLAEKEILLKNGESYRPDRILLSKEETIIIDFKTGEKKESHKKQLEKYAEALTKMEYKNIKKVLIYVDENKEYVLF